MNDLHQHDCWILAGCRLIKAERGKEMLLLSAFSPNADRERRKLESFLHAQLLIISPVRRHEPKPRSFIAIVAIVRDCSDEIMSVLIHKVSLKDPVFRQPSIVSRFWGYIAVEFSISHFFLSAAQLWDWPQIPNLSTSTHYQSHHTISERSCAPRLERINKRILRVTCHLLSLFDSLWKRLKIYACILLFVSYEETPWEALITNQPCESALFPRTCVVSTCS